MEYYNLKGHADQYIHRTDALLSYETVHQSGAVSMEISRYGKLISYFQKAEYDVFFSLNLLNVVQNSVFTLGILVVCYWNAYQISTDLHKVATFVTLLTYLAQLQAPLNFFGSFYTRSVYIAIPHIRCPEWTFLEFMTPNRMLILDQQVTLSYLPNTKHTLM